MNRHMIPALAVLGVLTATPALAAGDVFFSLRNTDFVVLLAFLIFIGILVYFKVPALLTGMLDKRADTISAELDEARRLREEAQTLLAEYRRKQQDVQAQADRIVEAAKKEAKASGEKAKADLQASIARRMTAAEEQIETARKSAVKAVRDQAAEVATAAAGIVIARQMTAEKSDALFDEALSAIRAKLH